MVAAGPMVSGKVDHFHPKLDLFFSQPYNIPGVFFRIIFAKGQGNDFARSPVSVSPKQTSWKVIN